MSEWNKSKLEQLIADGIEESLGLEYKRAAALANNDGKAAIEITKDVSAFANASGGVLIYGVAEPNDKAKRHRPERLDPVSRNTVSKEWLEQIIQTIQPKIDGVIIHPVTLDEQKGEVCYIVEIPQSHTAHQARDHVYYKRHNFNAVPMEDYEVRDVMNRKSHPKLRASIHINRLLKRRDGAIPKPIGMVHVRLENVSRVLVKEVMVELHLPVNLGELGIIHCGDSSYLETGPDGSYHLVRLFQGLRKVPIFPGSFALFRHELSYGGRVVEGEALISTRHIRMTVFADEMPAMTGIIETPSVLSGWTTLEPPPR